MSAVDDHRAAALAAEPRVASMQAAWTLALLTLIFAFNQLDRGIVSLVLDAIKHEMRLSDTMLGMMTGLGFSIVYAFTAFPLGRIADRRSRVAILSGGILFYSAAAALMGSAQNVWQLVAARSAVAAGEASGSAASASLIADLYPMRKRTRANAIWSAGSYLGLFLGLTVGGWLQAHYGWRVALWATALPGLVVGMLFLATVQEPARGASDPANVGPGGESVGDTIRFLFSQPSFCWLLAAMTFSGITNYSVQAWVPSLLHRVHHLSDTQVGFYAGFFKGLMGLAGILLGGFLSERLGRDALGRIVIVPIISSLLVPIAFGLFLWADDATISLVMLGIGSLLTPAYYAASVTMIQSSAQPAMRAMAVTIIFSVVLLVGLGMGPTLTGYLSDHFAPTYGANSLRLALVAPVLLCIPAAYAFLKAGRSIEMDAQRALT